MDSYKTLKAFGQAECIVKKSRFIGYAAPVKSDEEAVAFINEIKQKHRDASHNVYAYSVREGQLKRYTDDGEPQGTAGVPVLDVILKEGIFDCAVVVTRYFGGTLLGTGGLVRAYSHSAKLALEAAGIGEMLRWSMLTVRCDYNFYGRLASLITEYEGIILDTIYEADVLVKFRVPELHESEFNNALIQASNGKYMCENHSYIYEFK